MTDFNTVTSIGTTEENTFPKKKRKKGFILQELGTDIEGSNKRGASFKGRMGDIKAGKHCNNPVEVNIQQVKCMTGQNATPIGINLLVIYI